MKHKHFFLTNSSGATKLAIALTVLGLLVSSVVVGYFFAAHAGYFFGGEPLIEDNIRPSSIRALKGN